MKYAGCVTEEMRGKATATDGKTKAAEFLRKAQRHFRAFIERDGYPCLGARAALNNRACDVHCYRTFGGRNAAALARDLSRFIASPLRRRSHFATFVAIFRRPLELTEMEFERGLWSTLRALNKIDATHHAWDPSVAADPRSPDFAFSFGNLAFYIVGLHGNSSRLSRRFPFPALIFNTHEQFRRLRIEGKWERMRARIRQRDVALQGASNPMLADFGERSEARQYSGRSVPDDWRAPFAARCPFAH